MNFHYKPDHLMKINAVVPLPAAARTPKPVFLDVKPKPIYDIHSRRKLELTGFNGDKISGYPPSRRDAFTEREDLKIVDNI